jgi:hypothetical protein
MKPPLTEDEARVTHVCGLGVAAFRATTLVTLTAEQNEALLSKCSKQAATIMQHPVQEGVWIPTEILAEILTVHDQLFDYDYGRIRGSTIAELIFETPRFQPLIGSRMVLPFLAALPTIWSSHHRGGTLLTDSMGGSEAWITAWALFPYPQYLRDVLRETFKTALKILGVRNPSVEYHSPKPDDPPYRHRYHLTWSS